MTARNAGRSRAAFQMTFANVVRGRPLAVYF